MAESNEMYAMPGQLLNDIGLAVKTKLDDMTDIPVEDLPMKIGMIDGGKCKYYGTLMADTTQFRLVDTMNIPAIQNGIVFLCYFGGSAPVAADAAGTAFFAVAFFRNGKLPMWVSYRTDGRVSFANIPTYGASGFQNANNATNQYFRIENGYIRSTGLASTTYIGAGAKVYVMTFNNAEY